MSEAAALTTLAGPEDPPVPERALALHAVVAHDWLVQYGGSERVVEEIRRILPNSRLLTSIRSASPLSEELADARTTFLQKLPGAPSHHEWLLPLMPLAWRAAGPVTGVDVVVSSSHACAKALRVGVGIPHVCYCHTPMRYAWDFAAERSRFPRPLVWPSKLAMAAFRDWDRRTAARVDVFVANSTAVARRIADAYGREATVVHPPVRTDFFTPSPAVPRDDFFLYVGRLVGYKRAGVVIDAFRGSRSRLVVVGTGAHEPALRARAGRNISFISNVTDEKLRDLYRSAIGLVHPAEEDFGIAMAEAQACGTPVIGLAEGGAADIVEDGLTGVLIDEATVAAVRRAVEQVGNATWDAAGIARSANRFASSRFRNEMRAVIAGAVIGDSRVAGRPRG